MSYLSIFLLIATIHQINSHTVLRVARSAEFSFDDHKEPFTFEKDDKLLENNGEVLHKIRAHQGGSGDPAGSIKVELEIENEQPGKLYTDFSFDSPEGNHFFEVIGGKGGKHRFLVNNYALDFKYNKNAPKFKISFRQVFLPADCTCPDMLTNYDRKDVDTPELYPNVNIAFSLAKFCSSLACSWNFDDVDKSEAVKFSYSGTLDAGDQFYVKSTNGSTNFKAEGFTQFSLPGKEPFSIYFLGSSTPKTRRNGELVIGYKAVEPTADDGGNE
ncbi:unnamed protein product, partial [Mesorhabditis belari]|uniref:Uncharacterized protein n=1 Tax=Mesorhabditis belari TaxID=2138241 RepID=A0AAF3J5Q8_9BILA